MNLNHQPWRGVEALSTADQSPEEIREEVLRIWCEVLERSRINATDNFLELGGDSLDACRIIERAGVQFEVKLGLGDLFDEPTVEGLAQRIGSLRQEPLLPLASQSPRTAPGSVPEAERRRLRGDWTERLNGALRTMELPVDRPWSHERVGGVATVPMALGHELTESIRELTIKESATVAMVLLTALKALLHRYTVSHDLIVAATGTVGEPTNAPDSVSTLVLRTSMEVGDTFLQLLRRIRGTTLGALDHLGVPLAQIAEDLHIDSPSETHRLYEVGFEFRRHFAFPAEPPGSCGTATGKEAREASVALTLAAEVRGEELVLAFRFAGDLFDRETIERLAGHYRNLLVAAIAAPHAAISNLPILTPAEYDRTVRDWNRTGTAYPVGSSLHHLVELQVDRTPNAIALVFQDRQLTFAELDSHANRLAKFLRAQGVGPDRLVGLCLERSCEMVVGLLAILKAGGAYVPLDPDYPVDRLRLMLDDAAPPVVLTQTHLLDRLPRTDATVLALDRDWPIVRGFDDSRPRADASPSDLAYVIYTSGSTGVPKGAMNTHAGICNRILWMQDAYPINGEDRILQKTPFSFDVSVWEVFWPLLAGARLVLARPGGHRDPAYLAALIGDAGISVVHFVPAMLGAFLDQPGLEESCRTLRHVFASGEALPEELARRRLRRLPARLHNLYGPTEAAIDVTYWECRPDDPPGPIPIGRPIANMQVYILNRGHQPLPVGVPGELYLGGVGVARGYLNRPELTAERFVVDPFDSSPGVRLYRTGDLARWRADGNLEFLGRLDDQVKVRGFRIEPGEIEAALAGLPGIRQAVVAARQHGPSDTRLVAYLVADRPSPGDSEIRDLLTQSLPEYMIPSAFVRLDAIPLTSSGKLDRRVLPEPDGSRPEIETRFVAPRTPLEESLAAIWCEILGLERVGVHDDFFHMGGNSLLAARVVVRLVTMSNRRVTLRSFFLCPTIAGLAQEMSRPVGSADGSPEEFSPIVRQQQDGPSPLSFAQQRLWFIHQLEGKELVAYNIPLATRLEGSLDVEALCLALGDIVERHEPLRTNFRLRNGEPEQVVLPSLPFSLPLIDLRHLAQAPRDAEVRTLADAEAARPFDLTADLMLRCVLVRTGEADHVLLLTLHHIAADGWSIGILWRELPELYDARLRGRPSSLPDLPIRYTDFAVWRRRTVVGERLERLMRYWQTRLEGLEPLELPTDRPRPPLFSYRAKRVEFQIPTDLCDRLRHLCRQTGVTLHMALLALFQALLARYTGRDDIAVGVPSAARGRVEIEGLIGFFVNTLVLRADLSGEPSFRELLERTMADALAAHEHQDLPFERLVEGLRPERLPNRHPLVQVFFQYLELPTPDFSRSGVVATPLPDPGLCVRFDIELLMRPRGAAVAGEIVFSSDLFDRETMERLAGHYRGLLVAALDRPDAPIAELSFLLPWERERLVDHWNATSSNFPHEATVHGLFEAQVVKNPIAVAVACQGRALSYGELNTRADLLARRLRSTGVGREDCVAILLPRSPEFIIAILATLKVGAAYVPLDPGQPHTRNRFMIVDASTKALVTTLDQASPFTDCSVATLLFEADHDPVSPSRDEQPETERPPAGTAADLAYVMYTSGSTGEPKGVLVEHRSIVRLVQGTSYATFGPDRVFLQLAPVAFDASTFEIWGALLHGAKLVIATEGPLDLDALHALIASHGVTTLWLTAGLFNEIVQSRPLILRGLQEILTGGQALSPRHIRMAYDQLPPPTRIINGYGPTECTTFACTYPIPREDFDLSGSIPIGRPIANTTAYVLDHAGNPAPIGVPGELYLGGVGVARGYLNRPELTAERFVVDPFDSSPGARLYRTGDLVRWRADGNLEFLGRLDHQVKVRGFRIEPGEIEAALAGLPGIRQAVVMARQYGPSDTRLVAYLVADRPSPGDSEIRDLLAQSLPEYMIPSAFVRLDAIPLTSSGKLDRRALPAPAAEDGRRTGTVHVPPRDERETKLAALWSKLLGVPEPGIHDDFFELGGHSLLAIRLVASVEAEFGQRISVAALFDRPMIASIADTLRSPVREPARPHVECFHRGTLGSSLVFLPSVFGHCAEGERLSRLFPRNIPSYGLSVQGDDPYWEGCHSLADMVRGFVEALLATVPQGPYILAGYSFGGLAAFEMARQMRERGLDVGHLIIIDQDLEPCSRSLRDRVLRDIPSILANLPGRVVQKDLKSPSRMVGAVYRKIKARLTQMFGKRDGGNATVDSLGDYELDRSDLPALYRERMAISLRAFRDYQPGIYHGDALLIRSEVRPLLHLAEPLMGWDEWIDGQLTVASVPGYHHNLFDEDRIGNVAREIQKIMGRS